MDEKKKCHFELVNALAKCSTLAEKTGRNLCVELLNHPIPSKIARHDDREADLWSIVSTCLDHQGGIDSLVTAVEAREKGSVHMPLVRQCADALKALLEREGHIGPTDTSGGCEGAQLEAGYGLSIGISTYRQFFDKEQKIPVPNPFPDLSFAAKDAQAFHDLLRERSYQGPEPLLNEDATRTGIMRALDNLWKACRNATNPLVLIFFSGHGARDEDGRHYLVPHDGVRDDLFGTALWSRTFENALRLFETNRLIVFLDACHAAGMEADGVKGDLQACDPALFLEETHQGSYVVASCMGNQVSRECDGHGIFSNQLLRILKCEKEEDYEDEEVELYGLVETLKVRVKETASALPSKPIQEPWSNVKKATDIVLAINQARRIDRITRELTLLEAVNSEFRRRKHKESEVIRLALRRFILGSLIENPLSYQLYFRQMAAKLNVAPPSVQFVCDVCDGVDEFLADEEGVRYARGTPGITGLRAGSARPEPPRPQAAIRPGVPSRSPTTPDQDASEILPAKRLSTPVGMPTIAGSPERRCLPSDDVAYLLENIREKATSFKYTGRIELLIRLLTRSDGMSDKEFKALQRITCSDGDAFWANLVDDLGERFESRWQNAFKPGAWACLPDDLNLALIAGRLRQPDRPVDQFVAGRLLPETRRDIAEYQGEGSYRLLAEALASCFNTLIHGPSIWDEQRFERIEPRRETAHIRSQNPQGQNLERLNRMLLEDAYPVELRKTSVEGPFSLRRGAASGNQGGSDA